MKKQTTKTNETTKNRKIKKKPADSELVKPETKRSKSKSIDKGQVKTSKVSNESKVRKSKSKPPKAKQSKQKSKPKDQVGIKKSTSISIDTIKQQKNKSSEKKQKIQEKKDDKSQSLKMMKKYRTSSIIEQLSQYSCELMPDKKYKIKMHDNYEIDENHKLYNKIETLFKLFIEKERKKSEGIFLKTRYSFFPVFQFLLSNEGLGEHKCCICQFEFEQPKEIDELQKLLLDIHDEDIVALKCSHLLHLECLKMLIGEKEWFKCPVCSMIYGKMIGDQPPGVMTWNVDNFTKCDGYPDVGTIIIHYSMQSGKRGNITFPGTGRTAYLPNNIQGNQILGLLKEAFDRKLIFTIGRSVTTGRDNQIVWNGIHHKTNTSGGSSYFGYPDPTYFDRVKLELAAKGVF